MFKDESLKYIFFSTYFICFSAAACIPCANETGVIVVRQAKPKFPTSYSSSESFGKVEFKADINGRDNKLNNIQIISQIPSDVDTKIILEMIKSSSYRLYTDEENHAPCSVKGHEFTLNFDLPQKLNLEVDIGL